MMDDGDASRFVQRLRGWVRTRAPRIYVLRLDLIVGYVLASLVAVFTISASISPTNVVSIESVAWACFWVSVAGSVWWFIDQVRRRSRLPKGLIGGMTWSPLVNMPCVVTLMAPPLLTTYVLAERMGAVVPVADLEHDMAALGFARPRNKAEKVGRMGHRHVGQKGRVHFHVDFPLEGTTFALDEVCEWESFVSEDSGAAAYRKYGTDPDQLADDLHTLCVWLKGLDSSRATRFGVADDFRGKAKGNTLQDLQAASILVMNDLGAPPEIQNAAQRAVSAYDALRLKMAIIVRSHNSYVGKSSDIHSFRNPRMWVVWWFIVVVFGFMVTFSHVLRLVEFGVALLVGFLVCLGVSGMRDWLVVMIGAEMLTVAVRVFAVACFVGGASLMTLDLLRFRMSRLGRVGVLTVITAPLVWLAVEWTLDADLFFIPHFHEWATMPWDEVGALVIAFGAFSLFLMLGSPLIAFLADQIRNTPSES